MATIWLVLNFMLRSCIVVSWPATPFFVLLKLPFVISLLPISGNSPHTVACQQKVTKQYSGWLAWAIFLLHASYYPGSECQQPRYTARALLAACAAVITSSLWLYSHLTCKLTFCMNLLCQFWRTCVNCMPKFPAVCRGHQGRCRMPELGSLR